MTDENSGGAEGGAPNPAPEANVGDAGGAPAPEANPTDWVSGMPEDLQGYVGTKGWKDPTQVAQSYRELEKFAGSKANYVEMPDPSDADAVKAVMQKLGTPTEIGGYEINLPEGASPDDKMMGSFKEAALGANLTAAQAQSMTNWFEGFKAEAGADAAAQSTADADQAISDLKSEWGRDFDANVAAGQNLVRAVGISTEEISALENQFDTPTVMNLMAKLGARLGDNTLLGEDGDGEGGFGMTQHQAKAKIAELGANADFRKRMYDPSHIGHKSALAEMDKLQKIAAGVK